MRVVSGISEIAPAFDGFILDLWGLLHNGERVFDGVLESLSELRKAEKRICLLSNSPHRTDSIARQLDSLGISRNFYDGIVSSGEMVHRFLSSRYDMGAVYFDLWPHSDTSTLSGLEGRYRKTHDIREADFVLAALLDGIKNTPEDYDSVLDIALEKNLALLCANPDFWVISGTRRYVCPGILAARYAEKGGHTIIIGKPYPDVYERALSVLERSDRTRILAAGDSLYTDVQGARGAGVSALFALSGIHGADVGYQSHTRTFDPDALDSLLAQSPYKPDLVVRDFAWR